MINRGASLPLILTEEIPISRTSNTNPLFSQNPKLNQSQIELNLFEGIQLQDNSLTNQLRSLSYFELLDQTPSIKQLFSKDYVDLVNNLVSIQESKNSNYLEQNDIYDQSMIIDKKLELAKELQIQKTVFQDSFISEGSHEKMITADTTSVNSSFSPQQDPSNVSYNHLLYQNNAGNFSSETVKQNVARLRPKFNNQETTAKPYDNKKKDKKTNSITKNLIKSAIRGLNKLTLKLNQFVQ